jgi:hypothetical protein
MWSAVLKDQGILYTLVFFMLHIWSGETIESSILVADPVFRTFI